MHVLQPELKCLCWNKISTEYPCKHFVNIYVWNKKSISLALKIALIKSKWQIGPDIHKLRGERRNTWKCVWRPFSQLEGNKLCGLVGIRVDCLIHVPELRFLNWYPPMIASYWHQTLSPLLPLSFIAASLQWHSCSSVQPPSSICLILSCNWQ